MSTTIAGLLTIIVGLILKWAKVDFLQEDLSQLIIAIVTLIGIGVAYYGRYKQGDITWYGTKRLVGKRR